MPVIRRKKEKNDPTTPALALGGLLLLIIIIYFFTATDDDVSATNNNNAGKVGPSFLMQRSSSLRHSVIKKRQQLRQALHKLGQNHMPMRLQKLRQDGAIVGERLSDVRAGKETVQELLHGVKNDETTNEPPMTLEDITSYLSKWITTLHETLIKAKYESHFGIWQTYHDLAVKTLYPWDRQYLKRMPERRDDGSIFLSIATYRDENCLNTVKWAFEKAKNPEKLFIGLVQQNCEKNCKSGVLVGGKIKDVEPDIDCHKVYCESAEGKELCEKGHIRALHINEPESLGPYAARYFASKLWYGEQWFMQIDAHMTFMQDWDAISIDMLNKAPSKKPVLSHYPPSHMLKLEGMSKQAASRLCGPVFATSDLENQIIRLEGADKYDKVQKSVPRFAPFTAAGYFVAHSDFLREVPFDPFLPWIFMGEEIIMSSRLWTAGYDIFSPIQSVVGHMYVRRHKPKFWESVHRAFTPGVHNPLQAMILNRVKYQLGYPEAAKDVLKPKNLLTAVEQYGMGKARPLERYLELVGLNMMTKEVTYTEWCEKGKPPPGFEEFKHLYD